MNPRLLYYYINAYSGVLLFFIDTVNDIVHQDSGSSLVYRIHHIMKVLYWAMFYVI